MSETLNNGDVGNVDEQIAALRAEVVSRGVEITRLAIEGEKYKEDAEGWKARADAAEGRLIKNAPHTPSCHRTPAICGIWTPDDPPPLGHDDPEAECPGCDCWKDAALKQARGEGEWARR